ncbi:MAG: flavin-dependent dehydrogenase, partial [Thermosynechococcaceae cyanobacterium]
MKQLLYIEIPTFDTDAVRHWLQSQWPTTSFSSRSDDLQVTSTSTGLKLQAQDRTVVLYLWQHLRTTYLKANQWSEQPLPNQAHILKTLTRSLRQAFPIQPQPFPDINLSQGDIFAALQPYYPLTAKYFQHIPNGEADLQRAYWWEKRWRDEVSKSFGPQS